MVRPVTAATVATVATAAKSAKTESLCAACPRAKERTGSDLEGLDQSFFVETLFVASAVKAIVAWTKIVATAEIQPRRPIGSF
jgi:hypothetical protein